MIAQHILVPTDFSDYANHALDYAIELANRLQARLTLLHVVQLAPLAMDDYDSSGFASYLEEMEAAAQQRMQACLRRARQQGLQGEALIVHEVPFQAIINTAQDQDADLIVMGTHGRTGLTHVLMGSVAEKVVRLAPCSVLVTRGKTEASDA